MENNEQPRDGPYEAALTQDQRVSLHNLLLSEASVAEARVIETTGATVRVPQSLLQKLTIISLPSRCAGEGGKMSVSVKGRSGWRAGDYDWEGKGGRREISRLPAGCSLLPC